VIDHREMVCVAKVDDGFHAGFENAPPISGEKNMPRL
jgi:hypothetical protein